MSDLPEPDRILDLPHPRHTKHLFGQEPAEAEFLSAYNSDRLHHAWLITGPRGIGKATLAWRITRFLMTVVEDDGGMFGAPEAPKSLDAPQDAPALARLEALSEPRLFLLRRPFNAKTEKLRAEITVDEVRRLKSFFELSASDGGRRVLIVDCMDEMNTNAANALLKLLEEPPKDVVMLLICHQPAGLLPTIRSRCRILRCAPLGTDDMAFALTGAHPDKLENPAALGEMSSGSVGQALELDAAGGLAIYETLLSMFSKGPLDRSIAIKFAEAASARGAEEKQALLFRLIDLFLARLARTGVAGPAPEAVNGEAGLMSRLCPNVTAARDWAKLAAELGARGKHGRAVNLDPAALILDMLIKIDNTAARIAR